MPETPVFRSIAWAACNPAYVQVMEEAMEKQLMADAEFLGEMSRMLGMSPKEMALEGAVIAVWPDGTRELRFPDKKVERGVDQATIRAAALKTVARNTVEAEDWLEKRRLDRERVERRIDAEIVAQEARLGVWARFWQAVRAAFE